MSVRSRRLAVAGVVAATMIAVPAAALASDPGTPSGKPAPSATATGAAAGKSAAATGAAVTKSPAAPGSAAAIKSAARQSGALSGATERAMVAALAAQLGVSHSAAQRALDQLQALNGPGVDPASPAFVAIARDLGVSAARLAAVLPALKQAARQSVAGQ